MSVNPISFRMPFETQLASMPSETQYVIRNVWNCITDLQSAVPVLKNQIDAVKSSAATTATTVNDYSEHKPDSWLSQQSSWTSFVPDKTERQRRICAPKQQFPYRCDTCANFLDAGDCLAVVLHNNQRGNLPSDPNTCVRHDQWGRILFAHGRQSDHGRF